MKSIKFIEPMRDAILAGKKTQTRRIVKPQPLVDYADIAKAYWNEDAGKWWFVPADVDEDSDPSPYCCLEYACPYGKVGDRLIIEGTDELIEITSQRAERLQEVSGSDARAEGIPSTWGEWKGAPPQWAGAVNHEYDNRTSAENFARLWDSINGKKAGCDWEANPWVWVLEFKRVEASDDTPL